MSSIESPSSREKFYLLSTVWFVLQEPFISLQMCSPFAMWHRLCIALFGFDSTDTQWDRGNYQLLRPPTEYKSARTPVGAMYGHITETKRVLSEPILSHRLAHVAILCMRYLRRRQDPNTPKTQDHLRTWAAKSRRSPWLWRCRTRVTFMGRSPACYRPSYSSIRQSRHMLFSERIQSEKFYEVQHTFYIWTLDLLYHTLRKARKSDKLTKELSKLFIPSSAPLMFPRRIKRVRNAVDAYLEKFCPPSSKIVGRR